MRTVPRAPTGSQAAKILYFPTHLHAVAEAARAAGVWEPAILAVLSEPVRPEDSARSPAWWQRRIELKQEELLDEARARRQGATAAGPSASANDAAPAPAPALTITHGDIANMVSLIAGARGALDDLWYAAADAASRKPESSRAFWRRDVHRRGYEVLRGLRAVENDLEDLRKRLP